MSINISIPRALTLLFLGISPLFSSISEIKAQTAEPDSLVYYWHKAFFAEVQKDPKTAISSYDKVRSLCEILPLNVKEWFKGTAFFGIARAKALLKDTVGARHALSNALARHFWNFPLLRTLDDLNNCCGKEWVDSQCTYWNSVRDKEMPFWHPQPALLLKPRVALPNPKYPVLIVLQGGNDCYERLVTRLDGLADSLNIVTVFPAGVHRISEVTNSWDNDTAGATIKLDNLIRELSKDPTIDSNNISLCGYSQGSQIAYYYGLSHPRKIRNIIAFSGFAPESVSPEEIRLAAANHMNIIAVSGSSDSPEFLRTSKQLQLEAQRQGLNFEMRIEPALPHGLPGDAVGYFSDIWKKLSSLSSPSVENLRLALPDGHPQVKDALSK